MANSPANKRQESESGSTPPTSTSTTDTTSSTTTSTTSTTDATTPTTDTSTTSASPTDTSTPTATSETTSSPIDTGSTSVAATDTASSDAGGQNTVSTIVQTTVITENGQTSTAVITSELTSGTTSADGSTSSSSGGSDSHTGAIVGGVVGGVALIAILAVLAWFCFKRRKRDEFDGNFDPDSVAKRDEASIQRLGRGGDADLLAAARGVDEPEVTPYTYGMQQNQPNGASFIGPVTAAGMGAGAGAGYLAGGGYDQKSRGSHANSPPTSYYDPNGHPMPSGPSEAGSGSASGHGLSDPRTSMSSGGVPYGASPYGPVSGPAQGYGMLGVPGTYQPGPVTPSSPTSHSTYSTYSGAGASAKEREAFAARYAQQTGQGLDVTYGQGGAAGPSGAGAPLTLQNPGAEDEARSIVVHQDGGRVREEDVEPPNEIPPTYESIRSEDQHH